jgi:TolB protein
MKPLVLLVAVGLAAASGAASAPDTVERSARASAKIAYVSVPRGGGPLPNATVHVVQADGSGKRTLARNVWPDAVSWSPDGRKLAFVRGVGVSGKDPVNTEVYVMNADGSAERRLTRNAGYDFFPAWSPDGRKIAFVRGRGGGQAPFESDLYVINADGSGERRLARDAHYAVWSPDGRKVYFGRGSDIYVMNADGSAQRNLTRDATYEDSPAWSPDGRRIAFVTHGSTSTNPTAGKPSGWPCCPAKANLYVMNADGSGKRRLASAPAGINASPTWSPDGRKIAFERAYQPYPKTPSKRFYYRTEIYVVNVDGSGRRRLTEGARPLWSPDGRRIAFVTRRHGDQEELYVMNADGSGQRRLTHSPTANDDLLAWSPAVK